MGILGDWKKKNQTEQAFCSNFHYKLQIPWHIFYGYIPKTLLGPVQGAAVIIALLLQPQWLCEVCAVGYCFAYKELSDLQSSQGHTWKSNRADTMKKSQANALTTEPSLPC